MEVITNKINKLFESKPKDILSVFFTAGYPQLDDTAAILSELERAGVDLVEIGMPFSDPIADGPTIQESSEEALKNGMSMKKLFQQLETVETEMPIILMGYINPVLQYGFEKFCEDAVRVGVSGLILPDLPMHEYETVYKGILQKYGLVNVFLITPQTSDERIRQIDKNSDSFIYMVSTASTTGARAQIEEDQIAYFNRINEMDLKNPRLIGFGISNKETFENACKYSNGAIIGSAFIKALSAGNDVQESVSKFIKDIK